MSLSQDSSRVSSSSSSSSAGNIKVFVRVRPVSQRELDSSSTCLVSMPTDNSLILHSNNDKARQDAAHLPSKSRQDKSFHFDKCIWSCDPNDVNYSDQENTYEMIGSEMLSNALKGYNSCIMAYGQTGSGKTHTMMGSGSEPGIIPHLSRDLFYRIEEEVNNKANVKFSIELSFFEIYQENVRDLLNPNNNKLLKIREHPSDKLPYIESLSEYKINSYYDIENLLAKGIKNRMTASTNMNSESSRSHSILTIKITQKKFLDNQLNNYETISSHLRLVDLAGSEKSSASGDNKLRKQEGSQINKSLTTLGRILTLLSETSKEKLASNKVMIPYRESILTWLLKESIGGNSKTAMVACISPCDYEETLSTLRYATITSKIENRAAIASNTKSFEISAIISKYESEKQELLNYIEELKVNQSKAEEEAETERESDRSLKDSSIKKLENYIKWQNEYINTMNFRNQTMIDNLTNENDKLIQQNHELSIMNLNKMSTTLPQNKPEFHTKLNNIKSELNEDPTLKSLQNQMDNLLNDEKSLVNKYLIKVD